MIYNETLKNEIKKDLSKAFNNVRENRKDVHALNELIKVLFIASTELHREGNYNDSETAYNLARDIAEYAHITF